MPRRRGFYGRGYKAAAKAQAQAQKIKIVLPPKPSLKELKNCYEGYVSASQESRIEALKKACDWHKLAADYLVKKSQNDPALTKELQDKVGHFGKAIKLEAEGLDKALDVSGQGHNRETALKLSCKRWELYNSAIDPVQRKDKHGDPLVNDAGNPDMTLSVSVQEFIDKYDAQKADLEAKEAQSAAKYFELLQALEQAFPDAPFKFKVSDEYQARKLSESRTEFIYPKVLARDLSKILRKEGILKIVAQELPHIAKASAIIEDPIDGRLRLDNKKQIEMMDQLLKGFVLFAQGENAPGRIIRKGDFGGFQQAAIPQPQGAAPHAPKSNVGGPRPPRTPRPAGQGGKPDCRTIQERVGHRDDL